MARPGSRVLLKSLGATSIVTLTGGSAFLLTGKPKTDTKTSEPVFRRAPNGDIISPKFPKIKSRAEQISDLRRSISQSSHDDEYDLLIIGGGATGSGIALDAVTRGLKVALVERDDFSSGTSSKSTKLVHGGVRYLEKAVWNLDYGQYCLVKEALRERKNFLNTAPHLSSSLPILLPIQQWWQVPYFWAGTKAYDLLAGGQGLEGSYYLSKKRALEAFPTLKKNLVGALVYYDGQQNDSRMNISLALTAALYGATTVNHIEVTNLEKNASGKICGAVVRDLESTRNSASDSSSQFTIHAKGVINATGPFADAIEHMDDPKRKDLVAPSEGVHIVLPRHLGPPNNMGLLDASTSDGRVMFMLPWEGNIVAGTTDTSCSVTDSPTARENDINFILKEVNKYLTPNVNLQRSDVLAAWSGIRPLMRDPNSPNTESLVRNHLVTVSPSGLLTCAGGKWTTYRQMAEDAVDEAIKTFDLKPSKAKVANKIDISGTIGAHEEAYFDGSCATLNLKVLGAHGYSETLHLDLIRQFGLDADIAVHLSRSYGDRAWEVANMNAERVSRKYPITRGEIEYAVRNEYAVTATDFLARRTRLAFLDADAALMALPAVVQDMSELCAWDQDRIRSEWSQSLRYLRSMGLDRAKWHLGMEEVMGQKDTSAAPRPASAEPLSQKAEGADDAGIDVAVPVAASA
jgi:glycerol-3-phosphate dehydrogenase